MSIPALTKTILAYTDARGGAGAHASVIEGLTLHRADNSQRAAHRVFKPTLCVVAQGSKWAIIGDRQLEYKAGQALVVSVELPGIGWVSEASPTEPYLGIIMEFDIALMRDVWDGLHLPFGPDDDTRSSVFVAGVDQRLADCVLRLVRLLDTPAAIPTLRPLIMREICYWLLTGPFGGEISRMTLAGSHAVSVLRAVHVLRDRFAEPVRVGELARVAQLSPSAFHRQFRAVTSMTPLQYQKQLRLLEARRLMVAEEANAEAAAFKVGYESASQFSREYTRMFGAPPRRDAAAVRSVVAGD